MALSLTVRRLNNTVADRTFAIAAAAEAGVVWTPQTVAGNLAAFPQVIMGVVIANWPDSPVGNINNRRVAFGVGGRHPTIATRMRLQILAVDPAIFPDTGSFAPARLRVADRVLRAVVDEFISRGFTVGEARRIRTTNAKITAYIRSISGVIEEVEATDGEARRYSMNLADASAFLLARSG